MKYLKTFEETIINSSDFKIGDYIKLKNNKVYKISSKTQVKERPYFVVPIDDKIEPKLPKLSDITLATKEEVEKEKIELSKAKFNL